MKDFQSRAENAMAFILSYSHHSRPENKQWVLDQVFRILIGTEVAYRGAIDFYEETPHDDGVVRKWDIGREPK